MIMLVVGGLVSVIATGSIVTASVLVRRYVRGVADALQELRTQIAGLTLKTDALNLNVEEQLKPQIEQHHTALLTVDSNMHTLVEALDNAVATSKTDTTVATPKTFGNKVSWAPHPARFGNPVTLP